MAALENTPAGRIEAIAEAQRQFFKGGKTLDVAFRKQALKKLLRALEKHEKAISDALWTDLHKSY